MDSYLQYGAIGVGLALALVAAQMLSQEYKREPVRTKVLWSIFGFLAFSMLLCTLGFLSERAPLLSSTLSSTQELQSKLDVLKRDQLVLIEDQKKFRKVCNAISQTNHLNAEEQGRKDMQVLCR